MVNWEIIISSVISTVIGVSFASVTGLLKFNSSFTRLGAEVKNLGKRMGEMKTEIAGIKTEMKTEIAGIKTEMKTEIAGIKTEMKTEIAGIKTEMKERDEKIEKTLKERDERIDKKFEEVKGDIKDLRAEIAGRKFIESFDGIKTDIKYIKEGFARSEERNRKSRSRGRAGSSLAKEKARAEQINARRALISSAGFEPLEESVRRRSGQKNAAIA